MIVKRGRKFYVESHQGKNLGGPYDSREEADERLRQVEYFKHNGDEEVEDADDAREMFQRFHRFAPRKVGDFAAGFSIPKTCRKLGKAIYVTYRSDKVDPGTLKRPHKPVDYIHEHDAGVGLYLPGDVAGYASIDVPSWITKVTALSLIGLYTGVGYEDATIKRKLEIEATAPYPEIYTIPSGKALIVVQGKSKVVALTWGGGLGVEGRGIVG